MRLTVRAMIVCAVLGVTTSSANAVEQRGRRNAQPAGARTTRKPTLGILPYLEQSNVVRGRASMAAQDVFVTELGRSRKVTVINRTRLGAQIKEKHATPPSELNAAAISTFGKAVGLDLVLFTSVTEYGSTDMSGGGGGAYQRRKPRTGGAAGVKIAASLINVSTGEITWSDEASVSAGGSGSNRDMIRKLQQAVHKMVASMRLPGN